MPWSRNWLTQAELEKCIENLSDSEDEFDDDEANDDETPLENVLDELDVENLPIEFDDGFVLESNCHVQNNQPEQNENTMEASDSEKVNVGREKEKIDRKKISNVQWRRGNLVLDDDAKSFKGCEKLGAGLMELDTPFAFFKYFFDNQPKNCRRIKLVPGSKESKCVINYYHNRIAASIPLEQKLSVDEQLCATKARHHLKQYMPAKPHKWGYKLFFLCGVSGFSYNFEIYTGSENLDKFRLPNESNLGAASNTVVRLCRVVPDNLNYVVYFDNYYTSLSLMSFLASKGIFALGTVRRNRIPNCKFPSEDTMKKSNRGSSWEYICNFDGVDVTSVAWKDNKNVFLSSTFAGELPKGKVNRFDKKQKKKIEIECPNLVFEYNRHMGGVDLFDSLIGRYKIVMRSKKWYMRLFYHLLDMTLVNAWLLYKRAAFQRNESNTLKLAEFRAEVANCLCRVGTERTSKRGRPSDVENQIVQKKKRSTTTSYIPPKDIRLDGKFHWPLYTATRQRCKFPLCKYCSQVKCNKCGVYLCLSKNNNCFLQFHTK